MKKTIPFFLLMALALTGCAAPAGLSQGEGYRRISMQEAMAMMETEAGYILLDVRTPQEYAAGHIPGALLLPNETIGGEDIAQLPDKEQLILVYCRSGNRSRQAAAKLVRLGYSSVVEIGGINSWPGEVVTD